MIVGLKSSNGETMALANPVDTNVGADLWLSKIQEEMKRSMKQELLEIMLDRTAKPSSFDPISFYLSHSKSSGQSLILVSHIMYTEFLSETLCSASRRQALKMFAEKCSSTIEDIIKLGSAMFQSQSTFRSCVLLALYFRDTVFQMIDSLPDMSAPSPEWISKCKVEFNPQELTIIISQSQHSAEYGYEYLGGAESLVWDVVVENSFRSMWVFCY